MNIVLECKKIQYNELGYKVSSTAEVLPHLSLCSQCCFSSTNSSSLFSLKTIKIPLETMRKIPINEYKSGISEKIKYPTIIANIR